MKRSRCGAELQAGTVIVEHNGRAFEIREYSDTLLLAQLKAHRPEKHSDRVERTVNDDGLSARRAAFIPLIPTLVKALCKAEIDGKEAHRKSLEHAKASGDALSHGNDPEEASLTV